MRLRVANQIDIEDVMTLAQSADHEVDPFCKMIGSAIIDGNDGEFVAYGYLKLIPEAVILMNPKASRRERVSAIWKLLLCAKQICLEAGMDEISVLTEDDKLADYLIKRNGFEEMIGRTLRTRIYEQKTYRRA